MARLPTVGSDDGTWGVILNDYLQQAHNDDGTLKSGIVHSTELAVESVQTAHLAPESVTLEKLSPEVAHAVTTTTISEGSIPESALSAAVQAKLDREIVLEDGAVTAPKLAPAAVTDMAVADTAAIAPTKIAGLVDSLASKANSVDVLHLSGSQTVDGAKDFVGALSVNGQPVISTLDLRLSDERTPLDASVTTVKLADGAVDTASLVDHAVTLQKLEAVGIANGLATLTANATLTASQVPGYLQQQALSQTFAPLSIGVDAQSDWSGPVSLTSTATRNSHLRRRLTGNTSLALANGDPSETYTCTLELQQDSVGSRSIALLNTRTAYGLQIELSTEPSAIDLIRLEWNGSTWFAFLGGAAMAIPAGWEA